MVWPLFTPLGGVQKQLGYFDYKDNWQLTTDNEPDILFPKEESLDDSLVRSQCLAHKQMSVQ